MTQPLLDKVLPLLHTMMHHAYAPYSDFRVGAVAAALDGSLYAGCNVENAAYPQGLCAEACAIASMVAHGHQKLSALFLMGNPLGSMPLTPCGGCRQKIREFADDSLPIHLYMPTGFSQTLLLSDILPFSFSPSNLTAPAHR